MDLVERWSGQLLLVGGAMVVIASIIHPQGSTSQFLLQSFWVPAHFIEYVGFMFILLGLVGWYSRFSSQLGRIGTVGFLISFFATATSGGFSLISEAIIRPYVAANSPSLNDALYANSVFIGATGIIIFSLYIGLLVFSVAVVRAKVLPRYGFWLVILQLAGLASLAGLAIAYAAVLVFEGLLGLSISGWGYAILSSQSRVASSERLQAS